MKKYTLQILPAVLFAFFLFFSGIIRHDVDKSEYINLANQSQFDCVGQLYHDTTPMGSCVLVAKNKVMTAAHCLIVSDFRKDTLEMNGSTIVMYIPYNDRIVETSSVYVVFNGVKTRVKSILIHPAYVDSTSDGACDLAIVELEESIENILPAVLNKTYDELGSEVTGVGYGAMGLANQPENVASRGIKNAGSNVIDSAGDYQLNGIPTLLFCDFDHPSDVSFNQMGNPTPTSLEYIFTGGDSGGGLFRQRDGQWELVGICSELILDNNRLIKTGYYGQVMAWTRIAAFQDWGM